MTISYAGNLSIVGLCPMLGTATADAAIAMAANFNGAAALHTQFSVSPPDLAAVLAADAALEAQFSTAIGLGMPGVSFAVSDCVNLAATLNAALSILPTLEALLAASIGLYGFTYSGAGNALGSALSTELATQWPDGNPSSGNCTALVFGLVDNASLSPPNIATTQFSSFLSGLTFGGSGLSYTGKLASLNALCTAILPATGQATAAINAQLAAEAALSASLSLTPPTLAAQLSAFAAAVANIAAIPPPSVVVSASANIMASLNAQFGLLIALGNILARYDATAFVYEYTGPSNAFGAAVTTELASTWGDGITPTSGSCAAVILGAADSVTATAMTSFFDGA